MRFQALDTAGTILQEWTTFSIGEGDISDSGMRESKNKVYEMSTMKEILEYCENQGCSFWEFVEQREAPGLQLLGGSIRHVGYAATIGMEHFLGLTCDPMRGLVQIPCIERNAQGASRALDAAVYARMTDGHHFVPFDKVIRVMKDTGHDLPSIYRETAEGGLAKS